MPAPLAARIGVGVIALTGLLASGDLSAAAARPPHADPVRAGQLRASSARLARLPGWRVLASSRRNPHRLSELVSADAPAANDAWALGVSLPARHPTRFTVLIEHWAGRHWQSVPLPAAVRKKFQPLDVADPTIRAAGPSGAWIFGSSWLRWDGSRWRAGSLPMPNIYSPPDVSSAAVFGPSDVWAFGGLFDPSNVRIGSYAAHFNGHRWSRVDVPDSRQITAVSTLSSTDSWAVTGHALVSLPGPAAGGSVLHWTGRQWTPLNLPTALARHAYLTSIIARSDRDVWVGGAVIRKRSSKGRIVLHPMVAHWNGRAWSVTELAGGSAHQYLTVSLAQDGAGGIWATGACPGCQKFPPVLMWHGQHGRWTGPPEELFGASKSANLLTLAQVGHSSSVWAVGTGSASQQWMIGLFGKVPH